MNNTLLAICFMAIAYSAYGLVNDEHDMDAETDFPIKQVRYANCIIQQSGQTVVYENGIVQDNGDVICGGK
jgi:hypothetical protein